MIDLLILLALLAIGYGAGRFAEYRHYQSIFKREDELRGLPAVATKFPPTDEQITDSFMVTGSVVVSVDYFKRFVANLRKLFGGRLKTYETLLDRARREAILRMKEEAQRGGAQLVFNVKLETASISKGRAQSIGSVEVLASGTALVRRS